MAPDADSQPGPLRAAAASPSADDSAPGPLRLMLSLYYGWYDLPKPEWERPAAAAVSRWRVEKRVSVVMRTAVCVVLWFTCAVVVTATLFVAGRRARLVPDVLPRARDPDG